MNAQKISSDTTNASKVISKNQNFSSNTHSKSNEKSVQKSMASGVSGVRYHIESMKHSINLINRELE